MKVLRITLTVSVKEISNWDRRLSLCVQLHSHC